jgi:uncharacterized protein YyaL (SSP411 family)
MRGGDGISMNDDERNSGSGRTDEKRISGNRLRGASSPYLLQHAGNPVDWYPWGREAFEAAARLDRPVFLSIGYSSCHWCHVMEKESFEDAETARILNDDYIAVKVDREERPDIDNIYMRVCQAMTGSGGWPLTIIMTPEQRPFFAGTYFPKTARFGRPGLIELLIHIAGLWRSDRDQLLGIGERITASLSAERFPSGGEQLDAAVLDEAYQDLVERYDKRYGGFGAAPKFPSPHNLTFLLRMWKRRGEAEALRMVDETLHAMRRGGIYDHLGGGFHRYSTDKRWLVPHFEKMLYDQAMLAIAYAEAFQVTRCAAYADTVRGIFDYVLSCMRSDDGVFYTAEDADSEGIEGKFYTWNRDEITEVLGAEHGDLFSSFYGVTDAGNVEGGNVLHEALSEESLAAERGIDMSVLRSTLGEGRRALLAARGKRVPPLRDDKVLTDWNGLMVAALAVGSRSLGERVYADAASRAVDFLLHVMRDGNGRLLHRYRHGEAAIPAYLDDYAFLAWGLLELYETMFAVRYLEAALELVESMIDLFGDDDRGGFYFAGRDGERLIARTKETYDGAIPSGNSLAAFVLLRLARLTGNAEFERRAEGIMRYFAPVVKGAPAGFTALLAALDFALGPTREIVIAGDAARDDTRHMLAVLRGRFLPHSVILLTGDGPNRRALERIVPTIREMGAVGGRATAYVCENFQCGLPVTEAAGLVSLIEYDKRMR